MARQESTPGSGARAAFGPGGIVTRGVRALAAPSEPFGPRRALTRMPVDLSDEITITEPARAQLAAHLADAQARFIRIHVGRG